MCKRKSILITTPSGTYKNLDEAYREARALTAHIKYYCQKRDYNVYNVIVGVSNINPRLAEYRFTPSGIGRPTRELFQKSRKCPYVETHIHVLIINSEHADTIAQIINGYLCKRHCSTINSDYRLHVRKNEIPDSDIERVSNYITVQSHNLFSCKSCISIENFNETNLSNENECENKLPYDKKESITTNPFNQEQNELLFNLRFLFLLAKFLFKLSKLFGGLYAQELLNIKNQLCAAADYTKRNMLAYAYEICEITTADLTLFRQKLRTLLRSSSIKDKELIELESENIYKNILEKLEKQQFSRG